MPGELIQGTDEWKAARLGKLTASRMADVLATTKTGPSASRKNYIAQLVAERLTGVPAESFSNGAMAWGVENEPFARAAYEIKTDCMVEQIGFVDHPTIAMAGMSPDGLVGEDGLIEIKAPNTATHIDYLLGRVPPPKYIPQMAWQIACSGRKWCDFVSFDPRMPDNLQLFVIRYVPEPGYIAAIEAEAVVFLGEVADMVEKLRALK